MESGLVLISLLIANLHCAVWPFLFIIFLPYIAEYFIAILADIVIYKKIKIFGIQTYISAIMLFKPENKERINELKAKISDIKAKNEKVKLLRKQEKKNPYKIKIEKNSNVKILIIVMIFCVLMGFITPIGDTPFTYLSKTMKGNTTENINEHLPMTLVNQTEVVCTLVIFLAIMIFTKVKIRLSDLFMIGGLTYLMLASRRQVSMFAIIGSVILSRMIIELIDMYIKNGIERTKKIFSSIPAILIIIMLSMCLTCYFGKDRKNEVYISNSSYPVQACDYIVNNIDLKNARFYNEYNYGSYMIFRGIPVFIDSRADLYSPEFNNTGNDIFMDFIETSGISKFYEDVFKKYDITHVITYKNSKTNMIIVKTDDKNYKELYSDENFVIYERLNVN